MIVKLYELEKNYSKQEVMKEVVNLMEQNNIVSKEYYDGVLLREKQASFYIGNFVSIPHAISDYHKFIKNNGIVILRSKKGINWDGEKVHYIIGIAAIGDKQIDVLSDIANAFSEEKLVLDSLELSLESLGKELGWK